MTSNEAVASIDDNDASSKPAAGYDDNDDNYGGSGACGDTCTSAAVDVRRREWRSAPAICGCVVDNDDICAYATHDDDGGGAGSGACGDTCTSATASGIVALDDNRGGGNDAVAAVNNGWFLLFFGS